MRLAISIKLHEIKSKEIIFAVKNNIAQRDRSFVVRERLHGLDRGPPTCWPHKKMTKLIDEASPAEKRAMHAGSRAAIKFRFIFLHQKNSTRKKNCRNNSSPKLINTQTHTQGRRIF